MSERVGVLHVVTLLGAHGRYGGPQTVARTVAARFGDEIWGGATAADLRAEPTRPGERRFYAVRPPVSGFSMLAVPGLWWALWRRLGSSTRPRLVHLHAGPELTGIAALLVLVSRRAAFVVQPHGMFTYPPGSMRARVIRRVFVPLIRWACAVVALTDVERDQLIALGLQPQQVEVVPNGIDLLGTEPAPRVHAEPVVAFVARLHPRKHPERFTAAAAELARRGRSARFVMAGPDEGGLALARSADPNGVVEQRGALGPEQARQVIADADVVVVCSDVEPFGIVAVEALALGAALLITDSCDLAGELGASGAALVTTTDPIAIADGIARLLDDPTARSAQVTAGRSLVGRRYSMDVIEPTWSSLYRRASATSQPDRQVLSSDGAP
jgi:glycosyltransferase involved in cell wall biosynthesis